MLISLVSSVTFLISNPFGKAPKYMSSTLAILAKATYLMITSIDAGNEPRYTIQKISAANPPNIYIKPNVKTVVGVKNSL